MENDRLDAAIENTALLPVETPTGRVWSSGERFVAPTAVEPASVNPACSYLASLGTEAGRRVMRYSLDQIARQAGRADHADMPWWTLTPAGTQAIRAWLADSSRYAPATGRRMLAAVRGVIREGWRLGYYDAERRERLIDVRAITGSSPTRGRSVTGGELAALFDACSADRNRAAGSRNAAVLAVLYAALRRAELVNLDLCDWDAVKARLTVRYGKGGKSRQVPVPPGGAAAIDDWIANRGLEPGPLFLPVDKSGKCGSTRLRPATVEKILTKLARRARLSGADTLRPHDMRRSFAGDFLDLTGDLSLLAGLMGHASGNDHVKWPHLDQADSSQRRNTDGCPRSVAMRSAGLSQPRTLRGRRFSSCWTRAMSSAVWTDRSVDLGK